MREALRVDAGQLAKPVKTELGYLRVDGYISRPGIYVYINTPEDEADGLGKAGATRRELRPDDEVFRADGLLAFEGMPITLGHPKKHLDASTVRGAEVGTVLSTRRDGDRIAATLMIKDPKVIAKLEKQKTKQLSPGYRMAEDLTPGVDPKYGAYDLVQRNIRPNHLALVDRARGGSDLAVRMDGISVGVERSDDWMDCDSPKPELIVMTTIVEGHQHTLCPEESAGSTSYAIAEGSPADTAAPHSHEWVRGLDGAIVIAENAGHTHAVDMTLLGVRADENDLAADAQRGDSMQTAEQLALLKVRADAADKLAAERKDEIDAAVTRADAAEAALKTAKETIGELTARIAAGTSVIETKAVKEQSDRADEAEKALVELKAKQPKLIAARCDAIVKAQAVLGEGYRADGKTDREIRVDVIKRLRPKEDVSGGVSDASIASRFDSLLDDRTRAASSLTRIDEAVVGDGRGLRNDSAPRRSTRESRANAWANQALEGLEKPGEKV